jgi:hypothetical protein
MKIMVDGKLTYECDYKVKVGDNVLLPAPYFMEGSTYVGKVTKLSSDYDGYCKSVIKVIK